MDSRIPALLNRVGLCFSVELFIDEFAASTCTYGCSSISKCDSDYVHGWTTYIISSPTMYVYCRSFIECMKRDSCT